MPHLSSHFRRALQERCRALREKCQEILNAVESNGQGMDGLENAALRASVDELALCVNSLRRLPAVAEYLHREQLPRRYSSKNVQMGPLQLVQTMASVAQFLS